MDLTSISKKLTDATTALAKADNDLKLEMAGAAADMAGIVDPTPASDIVGAGISIARGDYWGAALSTASMVPYLGDAVAKPVKAVRATKAIAGLKTKVAALTKTVNDLKKAKKEAEAVAAAKQAKIAKEADVAKDGAAKQEKAAAKKEKDCEDCGATGANSAAETVKVFRVEGGGNQRLLIDDAGNVNIPEILTNKGRGPERNLYLNFGDEARAQQFLEQRLQQFPDNTIKSFDVPKSFLDELRATAVPEAQRSLHPTRPVVADPTKAPNQYGLTAEQLQKLRKIIVKGSGGG